MNEPSQSRWEPRPILSFVIRAAVFVVPIAAAVATAFAIRRALPEPEGIVRTIIWVAQIAIPATAVLKVIELLGRRLLPLAALFRMSLLFPDEAPSRLALARRSGRVSDLKKALVEMKARGVSDESSEAAETILSLAAALASHDKITRGHSERVRVFVDLIADEMKLTAPERDRLRWAALLHDIGKLTVPGTILNKVEALHPQERAIIERHPIEGMKLIAPIAGWLGPWSAAVVEHHERFDGLGYPYMVKSPNISLGGRIVAVADAFECITSARPYSKPMSTADARRELARCAGSQFDPEVVRAFLNISIGKLWRGAGLLSWIAAIPYFPKPMFSGVEKFGRTLTGGVVAATGIAVIAAIGVTDAGTARPSSVLGQKLLRPAAVAPVEVPVPPLGDVALEIPAQAKADSPVAITQAGAVPQAGPVLQPPVAITQAGAVPQAGPVLQPPVKTIKSQTPKGSTSRAGRQASHGTCMSTFVHSDLAQKKGKQVSLAARNISTC